MSTLRNKVQLVGNLGEAPKVTVFESGKKVARFSLATNESYKNSSGEKVTSTQWHSCVAWGKTADIVEKFLDKGKEVAIDGKLNYRSFTDDNGMERKVTEIVCDELLLLGNKPVAEPTPTTKKASKKKAPVTA